MDLTQFFPSFFFFFLLKSTLSPSSTTFQNNFTLYDDAHFTKDGTISLTRELPGSLGRALHSPPIQFLDPSTNSTTPSFSCNFSFTITTTPSSAPGEGLAFLITSPNSSSSGRFGLPNRTTGSVRESFLAVEFDTGFDRIGLDVDGVLISSFSSGAEAAGIDLKSGNKIRSWVEYQDEKKTVKIWVSPSSIKPPAPVISTSIDLSEKILQEFMHVGFSASNGPRRSALHFVESWEFANFGFLSTVGAKEEEGLIRGNIQLIVFGLIILLGLLVWPVALVGSIKRYLPKKLKGRIPLEKFREITNGFDISKRVGQESHWGVSVYRGLPPVGSPLAINKLTKIDRVADFEKIAHQKAEDIHKLKHKNLLRLQAWCFEEPLVILAYKFVDGPTLRVMLDRFADTSRGELNWKRSVNILVEVASALAYMHGQQVIHNNIETSNILLDRNWKAKLGGFGFLQKPPDDPLRRPYVAPEGHSLLQGTLQTDVYSFGVVILEVVTGRPPVDRQGVMLVDVFRDMHDKDRMLKLGREREHDEQEMREVLKLRRGYVDAAHARVGDRCDKQQMTQVLELGEHCVNRERAIDRLPMSAVESVLRGKFTLHVAIRDRMT